MLADVKVPGGRGVLRTSSGHTYGGTRERHQHLTEVGVRGGCYT
jgi:hypothetical protein